MRILINIATLFLIGSILGYLVEVLFKRLISKKKWVNPGFMRGPYLPIYGFGVIALYGFWNISFGLPDWVAIILKLLIICVGMTLLELITGLFFLKVFNMRLWDYTDRWANYKGVICPLFSLLWTIAGGLYYFLLNGLLIKALDTINNNLIYSFFIGVGIGMIIVDALYSFHVGIKVKKALNGLQINYNNFRESFKETKQGKRFATFSMLLSSKAEELKEHALKTKEKFSRKKKLNKK